jgi:hypothetical protein
MVRSLASWRSAISAASSLRPDDEARGRSTVSQRAETMGPRGGPAIAEQEDLAAGMAMHAAGNVSRSRHF